MKKKLIFILLLNINNFSFYFIHANDAPHQAYNDFSQDVPLFEKDDLDDFIQNSNYEIKPQIRPAPLWLDIAKTVGGKIFLVTLALINKCKKTWHSFKLLIGYAHHSKK